MTQTAHIDASPYLSLLSVAHRQPDRTALTYEGKGWNFRLFLEAVDLTAAAMHSDGISKGDCVGVLAPNTPEVLFAYYAASRIGATFVPINPALTANEVAYTIEHSGLVSLYLHADMADHVDHSLYGELVKPLDRLAAAKDDFVLPEVNTPEPNDDFLLCYTSGSTGTPKAVMLTSGGQVAAPKALAKMWGIEPGQTVLVALPLGFLYGLSTGCAMALQSGATVALQRRFHPGEILEAFIEHRPNIFQGVPTMFSMMLEYCEQRDLVVDLSTVDSLISAGAPLSLELMQRFEARFRNTIQNYFAMTEVTPIFGVYKGDTIPVPPGAIGKAAPEAEIRIKRADGSLCDVDEDGELFVRGASTMSRYEKAVHLTSDVFEDGFFRTGDLGRVDKNGFYYITGRIKDIIIRGGANIAPSEVESVLNAHPSVQDVSVVGAPDRIFGEVPVAFVVLRHGQSVSAEELEAYAEERLANFKVPRSYRFESELPLGKTGKIDKVTLSERLRKQGEEA